MPQLPVVSLNAQPPAPSQAPDWVKVQLPGCNLRCSFCSQDIWREIGRHDRGQWLGSVRHNVLDQLPRLRLLIITGGEPLMSPAALRELLEWCQSHGTETGIFTNCTLMSTRRARNLTDLGLAWVRTTLNGYLPEVHEQSYPKGSFARTVAGIGHAQAAGIPVKVRSTVTRGNQRHLARLAAFAASLGVRELDFRPYMPLGDCNPHQDNTLGPAELIGATATLTALAEHWRGRLEIKLLPNFFDFLYAGSLDPRPAPCQACHCGIRYIYVDAAGQYRACAGHRQLLGSVHELTVEQVWQSSGYLDSIRTYQQDSYCSGCPARVQCRLSNCHLVSMEVHGRFDTVNPMCPVFQIDRDSAANGAAAVCQLFADRLAQARAELGTGSAEPGGS